jgi:hypothetical protein
MRVFMCVRVCVCVAVCPSGTQLAAVGGTCQNCSIGYYRTLGLQDSCVQCRTGWVTPTVRSVSDVACTVREYISISLMLI